MTISARTKLGADELDAFAQTLRPSWELLFGNGAPQDFIPPPTPPTRRVAEAQPARLPSAEPRIRRQDSLPARTPSSGAQKPFPEPAVSLPTAQTPWTKIAILAAVAVVAGGIAIMLTRGGDETVSPSSNATPAETQPPAVEEKPVASEEKAPEEKAPEPTPAVEEKASEPPAPPPVAAPLPAPPKHTAPKAPAPKAASPKPPAPKAPAPKAPGPKPKGDGIVREVPF